MVSLLLPPHKPHLQMPCITFRFFAGPSEPAGSRSRPSPAEKGDEEAAAPGLPFLAIQAGLGKAGLPVSFCMAATTTANFLQGSTWCKVVETSMLPINKQTQTTYTTQWLMLQLNTQLSSDVFNNTLNRNWLWALRPKRGTMPCAGLSQGDRRKACVQTQYGCRV
jgi:hypothetical protein